MKAVAKNIIISFVFAVLGIIWLALNLRGNHEWILYWIDVLLAYLSLFFLILVYCKNEYNKKLPRVLIKIAVISFNTGALGILIGIIYELLEKWTYKTLMLYWLVILFLYLMTIISLVILVFVNRNDPSYNWLYKILILLSILFTLGPVIFPVVLTIIGNGMNASGGWSNI
ncbi:DUF3902 family protein [Bacillus thuringiensis]|uniref:DUF3902 family protein n=1 Tax=Bacillus thuringiensis TaxID=1428 RepID=UPI0005AF140C|nr:DUF3902 family protein [Bacillus thuringiensis]MCT6946971.1 DUF3902 family protein [Bacillus thuringiensis]MED2076409.1 DUF3902 family protein [Bacillus thuringiensis]NUW50774.1 DUF3902 family protein [Bacillus thuringiensis]HDR6819595.1 DUF3902 family protein [Bacillus thuringiensis]